ncbi:tetratricopeptide repeat-containing sulfotransferase family protein [Novosphingobium mangrovi (ex Huang et al. 2023)]|uniref:Sulfotransferase n=1 Tax=Novosphingobium mangrovi (ex Huang et al. 2023) TaxID=2976432 RepID=A0ABT2I4E2_9SPHN|nr:tetratricopeptide repeat-containing sulfotransferase family protein [Novosphingobium mangrovi (ex Huang et al. 2023)]MCT2399677.1 sulfotransferase [Novosphingobium mangrovi (ex Huang et al. 2023)]
MAPYQSFPKPEIVSRLQAAAARFISEPEAACADIKALIRDEPDFLPARRVLARLLRNRGHTSQAMLVEAEAIALGIQRPGFASAQEAFLSGDIAKAEPLVRNHLKQDPEDPAAAMMLGDIAAQCRAQREAENLYRRAILLAPTYVEARIALAKLQRDTGRYIEALDTLAQSLNIRPDHLPSLSLKAAILVQQRRFEKAEAVFGELHDHHPQDARGWCNHAFLLKTIGHLGDAVTAYRQAIAIDAANGLAWWGLANLKTVHFNADDVAAMRDALNGASVTSEQRVHLSYALGKALDDLGDSAGAFAAYSQGARQRLLETPHDPLKNEQHVSKVLATCTADFFEARTGVGHQARDPIFIVSLPRSGSTLVEQILASHPLIEGTEELHDIERIALGLAPQGGTGGWLDVVRLLPPEKLHELGGHYIAATRRFRETERPFFTDKMPSNWVFAGLIHLILPNAKIVDIRRHPLGCGFANFSQHFNQGINFSYDLEHIGRFYSAYVRQMAHFDKVLPGRIHHLTYEALVEDTEAEVRRLLDYLELPFEPACLRFFENRRAVHTPSSEQVRSPITRDGMERWQRYAPFLEPLKEALGPVLTHYPKAPPSFTD